MYFVHSSSNTIGLTTTTNSWQDAFDENRNVFVSKLYEEQRQPFINWARSKFSMEDDEILDVYQDSIIVLYNRLKKGDLELIKDSLQAYLFGICKNLMLKKTAKNKKIQLSENMNDYLIKSFDLELYHKMDMDHQKSIVSSGLSQLKDNCRRIIYLFYYHRFSLESIKDEMDYSSVDVAKSRKNQCLNKLRELLKSK